MLQLVGTEDGRWMPSQTSGYARAGAITLVGPGRKCKKRTLAITKKRQE